MPGTTSDHHGRSDGAPRVVIVGAGPVGLWLASELGRGGVRVLLVEKRAQRSSWSRALTVHPRTLEVLAMRGEVGDLIREGHPVPSGHYAMLPTRLDFRALDTSFPFALFLPQVRTEHFLELIAQRHGVVTEYGAEVTAVDQDDHGVHVTVRRGGRLEKIDADYIVGCDGRHSAVRGAAGIPYVGTDSTFTAVGADAQIDPARLPAPADAHTREGAVYAIKLDDTHFRLIVHDRATCDLPPDAPLTVDDLRASVRRILGHDLDLHDVSWLNRVGNDTYQAARYRDRRIFVAGDAAHVHFPMGGQGLNLGVQDAMNLGWKLAAVARGLASDALLDTYQHERAPVGAAVVQDTLAQTAIVYAPGREGDALRLMFTQTVLSEASMNERLARFVSALDVAYPPTGPAHPLVGRRAPDLPLSDGSRLFDHLVSARFCLLGASEREVAVPGPPDSAQLTVVPALPVTDDAAWRDISLLLVRPDGYVAWAAEAAAAPRMADASAALRTCLWALSAPAPADSASADPAPAMPLL